MSPVCAAASAMYMRASLYVTSGNGSARELYLSWNQLVVTKSDPGSPLVMTFTRGSGTPSFWVGRPAGSIVRPR